jgi:hypothetical protein
MICTLMSRRIPPRLTLPDNDCMCPESVSTIAGRDDLSPGLKRKLLGENAATLFALKA